MSDSHIAGYPFHEWSDQRLFEWLSSDFNGRTQTSFLQECDEQTLERVIGFGYANIIISASHNPNFTKKSMRMVLDFVYKEAYVSISEAILKTLLKKEILDNDMFEEIVDYALRKIESYKEQPRKNKSTISEYFIVRIMSNKYCTVEVVKKFQKTPRFNVVKYLVSCLKSDINDDVFEYFFSLRQTVQIAQSFAMNPKLTFDMMGKIAQKKKPEIFNFLIINPSLPDELFQQLCYKEGVNYSNIHRKLAQKTYNELMAIQPVLQHLLSCPNRELRTFVFHVLRPTLVLDENIPNEWLEAQYDIDLQN